MERLGRLHGRVVELDALPDADRSGANDHGPRAPERHGLVLVLVRRIEVRRCRGKLSGAGVHHLVDRKHANRFAQASNFRFGAAG